MVESRQIIIGKPYVVSEGDYCKLVSDVVYMGLKKEIFFEVDREFSSYLTPERADPFVLLLLVPALYDGCNIVCEAPMTEQLHFQLRDCLLPVMAKYIDQYHPISIKADFAEEVISSKSAVVTGLSAGVDSFYTIFTHVDSEERGQRLSHLIMNNVGALTKNYDHSVDVFKRRAVKFQGIADYFDLKLVCVNTNIVEMLEDYPMFINSPDLFRNAACAFALKRLFGCYYYSSAVDLNKFCFTWESPEFYEPVINHALSVRSLVFYTTGYEAERGQKVEAIADEEIVKEYLNVCGDENDSSCEKCTRTMFELYALGKLDEYDKVFDVDFFKENLGDRIACSIASPHERMYGYCQESLAIARRNGVHIPMSAYFRAIFKYAPLYALKRLLGTNVRLQTFYKKYDLRTKLFNSGKKAH